MNTIFRPGQAFPFLSIALVVAVAPYVAIAQTTPDVGDILKKVSERYANLKRYHFSMTATSRQLNRSGQVKVDTITTEIAVERPDKLRMGMGVGAVLTSDLGEMLTVVDGGSTWNYVPKMKQYTKYRGAPVHSDPNDDESETKPGAPSEFPELAGEPASRRQSSRASP